MIIAAQKVASVSVERIFKHGGANFFGETYNEA